MRQFKILYLLLGLMFGIASCSKERQDIAPSFAEEQEYGVTKYVGSRDSVLVSFTIGADTEGLRLAQSLNADGVPVSPFMEEKDVVIRFFTRKSGRITHTDAICQKVVGENIVTYKGKIRLPDLGYGDTTPVDLSGHQIAGVLLGEANGGAQFVNIVSPLSVQSIEQSELLTAEDNVLRSKVPYILDWINFPLTAQGKQIEKQVLHFRPVGNLLRIQLENQSGEAKTLESFKLTTNAFLTAVSFNFWDSLRKQPNQYSSYPEPYTGGPFSFLPSNYQLEKSYELRSPIRVEAKSKSKWYYLWVMPLMYAQRMLDNGTVSLSTRIVGRASDGKDYNMLAICSPLTEGTNSLRMSFKIASTLETAFKGGKLPLWYLAEGDVAPDGKSLAAPNALYDKTELGFFETKDFHKINVPGYYIPDEYDLYAIVHGKIPYNLSYRLIANIRSSYQQTHPESNLLNRPAVVTEEVLFPGHKNPTRVSSTYIVKQDPGSDATNPKYTIYGLRFDACGERDKLVAYRYRYLDYSWREESYQYGGDASDPTEVSGIHHLVVMNEKTGNFELNSVFLGSGFTGDINTIANPSFWEDKLHDSNSVTRFVRTSDYYSIRRGYKSQWMLHTYYMDSHMNSSPNAVTPVPFPVRLIKNEFKTAQ